MFTVSYSDFFDLDLALIEGAPKILLFDAVPILFTGRNRNGNHIIGSAVADDYDNRFERYFHIIVSHEDFRSFHGGNISYLELLKQAKPVYVIDRELETEALTVGYVSFDAIPDEYRPTAHTFFPSSAREPSIEYTTRLSGGSAVDHLADPKHVSVIQNSISEILQKSLHALQLRLGFTIDTKLSPATASSYGINYVITLANYPLVLASESDLLGFVNKFTEFCLDHLPVEIDGLLDNTNVNAPDTHFQQLFDSALRLAPITARNDEDLDKRTDEFRNELRKDVLAVPAILESVAEIVHESYDSLEILNNDVPLGTINDSFNTSLEQVLAKLNEETVDDRLRPFRIMVYSFNKHSGKGRANVLIEDQVTQIYIHVLDVNGPDGNGSDRFIESMKQDRYFDVIGRMTYRGNQPYRLEI